MTDKEQIKAAKALVTRWEGKGDEKQETALFWIDLLQNVLGVENPTSIIQFEKPVVIEKNTKFIDGFIPSTKVLIEQKAKIEKTAQAILEARALYPNSSLADLYDELTMPPELRKAHQANDKAVMEAYGFWGKLNTESECVAELMKMYQKLTEKN